MPTKITKARFVYTPLSGQRMAEIGQALIGTIFERWDRGIGLDDSPAKPLAEHRQGRKDGSFGFAKGYRVTKQRQYGSGIRDLNRTGTLRRSIQVLGSTYNEFTIGPVEGVHTQLKHGGALSFHAVLAINNAWSPMWGVSRADHFRVKQLIAESRPVKAVEIERAA